jgi:exodeoxyribonuclease VII small subunit
MKKTSLKTFEEDLARLQEISTMLDNDQLPLEEAIMLYEEGVELSRACVEILKSAELKITQIKKKLQAESHEEEIFEE